MTGELSVRIAGAAGDGIASAGEILSKVSSRMGLHVFAYNSFQSAIRGGYVWLQMRIGNHKIYTEGDKAEILIPLNQASFDLHVHEIEDHGCVIYNQDKIKPSAETPKDTTLYPLPVNQLLAPFPKNPLAQNTLALGAAMFIGSFEFGKVADVIRERFQHKTAEIQEQNIAVCKAGYDYAQANFKGLGKKLKGDGKERLFLTGNMAAGIGAAAAGCKMIAAYPMSPSSGVLHWMASHADLCGILVKQVEDEIAAINYAVSAGQMGVRAMTSTSGGGFALMTEAIGLAGMFEAPVVVLTSQRGGPSTGLPTKTEQGDLNQIFGASQGDFPKIMLAPRTIEECFYKMTEAFNLAEKYQVPVIVALDQYLSDSFGTVDDLDLNPKIERGELVADNAPNYLRFKLTDSGVSPRALPGQPGNMYTAASDEHDEKGDVISDVLAGLPESNKIREKIVMKRARKLEGAKKDMALPEFYGAKEADITLVGWGSSYSAICEAVDLLTSQGVKANALTFANIFPLDVERTKAVLQKCRKLVSVELNFSNQFNRHLRAELGIDITEKINKWDGTPFYPQEIVKKVKEVLAHAR